MGSLLPNQPLNKNYIPPISSRNFITSLIILPSITSLFHLAILPSIFVLPLVMGIIQSNPSINPKWRCVMWLVYLVCVVIGYWVIRKPVKRLIGISTEYIDVLELEANYDLRERGGELASKLDKVKDKPLPSELLDQFRAK